MPSNTPVLLRASQTPRAFNCPGSVWMEQNVPPAPDSDDSKEGTAAHEVADLTLKGVVSSCIELVDRQMSNGVIVSGDMAEYVQGYVDFVRSWGVAYETESPVSIQYGYLNVEGTADASGYDQQTRTLRVGDLKYGYRIVEAVGNWQTLIYGAGKAMQIGCNNIDKIVLTIYQPRPFHSDGVIRSETIDIAELTRRLDEANAISQTINDGTAKLHTGEHCKYCPAFHSCPAAQQAGLNAVDAVSVAVLQDMPNEALASELRTMKRAADMLKNRMSALTEMTRDRIKSGQDVPGWGVEASYGNSVWTVDADMLALMTGQDLTDKKLVTPAEAKRRGVDKDLVSSITERPFKGWNLTEVDLNKKAQRIFNDGK